SSRPTVKERNGKGSVSEAVVSPSWGEGKGKIAREGCQLNSVDLSYREDTKLEGKGLGIRCTAGREKEGGSDLSKDHLDLKQEGWVKEGKQVGRDLNSKTKDTPPETAKQKKQPTVEGKDQDYRKQQLGKCIPYKLQPTEDGSFGGHDGPVSSSQVSPSLRTTKKDQGHGTQTGEEKEKSHFTDIVTMTHSFVGLPRDDGNLGGAVRALSCDYSSSTKKRTCLEDEWTTPSRDNCATIPTVWEGDEAGSGVECEM
ncbi:unnamed protein product, partial [Choristocarpus tenellus]